MSEDVTYRRLSFWHETVPGPLMPRPSLNGNVRADVAIVGAGFTGLWTAYELARAEPSLRIAVLEREIAGFGASGRNGGWVSSAFPAPKRVVADAYGHDAAVALQRALFDTVDEVGRVCDEEGIDAHFRKGGALAVATLEPEADRFLAAIDDDRAFGFGPDDVVWLSADELDRRVRVAGAIGGSFTPHCARVHPARLARGLADVVERRGVHVFERTRVRSVHDGLVEADGGRVRADTVVFAVEGYGTDIRPRQRTVAPVYSYMVATEPLPASFWDEVGWGNDECVWDGPRMYLYAQRTEDDRIAIGGRDPCAVRVARRPGFRSPRAGVPADPRDHRATVARSRGCEDHARMGRCARGGARLVPVGGHRSRAWAGVGGRLRGRWGRSREPGRADPPRPDPRT